MNGILTKWLVQQEHTVTAQELDHGGNVSDEAVRQWVDAARLAYLSRCPELRKAQEQPALELRCHTRALPSGALLGRPASVLVTASATEVRPSSFTISVRIRAIDGDRAVAINASCVVRIEDAETGKVHELGNQIRDELIALEHSARHFN